MGIHNTHMYEKAIVAMAKQSVTLEVLSYHASASMEDAHRLRVRVFLYRYQISFRFCFSTFQTNQSKWNERGIQNKKWNPLTSITFFKFNLCFHFFSAFENSICCILSIAWLQFWWHLHGWWWHIEGNCILFFTLCAQSCQHCQMQWKSTVHCCSISIYLFVFLCCSQFMTGMSTNVFGIGLCWTFSYWLWSAVPMAVKR